MACSSSNAVDMATDMIDVLPLPDYHLFAWKMAGMKEEKSVVENQF